MTVEERLARLETRADGTDKWLSSIDEKVDRLLALANMGKGSWRTILWLGGSLAGLAALLGTLAGLLHWRPPT